MSQNGQWAPVDADGGFGYVDEPTILFAGNVSDFEEKPKEGWGITIPLTDAPDDLFPRHGDVTKVVITDPNVENTTMLAENNREGSGFIWTTETDRTNEIFYRIYEDNDDVYLYISKDTDDPIEVSITVEGYIHTIDQKYTFPIPERAGKTLVSVETTNGYEWKIATGAPFVVNFDSQGTTFTTYDQIDDAYQSGRVIYGIYATSDSGRTSTRVTRVYDDRHGTTTYTFDFSVFTYDSANNKINAKVLTISIDNFGNSNKSGASKLITPDA